MAVKFITIDRDTPLLLPPDLRDWVKPDHLVHFIIDAVGQIDVSAAQVNERGTGSPQYPPGVLLSLLVYSYATGVFSSRQIERNTYENIAVRLLCADTHPDHDTLCTFRRKNLGLLNTAFAQVLELAARSGVLKVGGITVAIDGTKILANASKHSAVSYEHAGKRPWGKEPTSPTPTPGPKDQYNFTDPVSRIMKAGSGAHFEQSYNAQAGVETASRLILGPRVCNAANDKEQLVPNLAAIGSHIDKLDHVLVDNGFVSEEAVTAAEHDSTGKTNGLIVLAAIKRHPHGRTIAQLECREDPPAPPPEASFTKRMIHRTATAAGKALYKLRQQTVEPVFGIIKQTLGFRRFSLRGLEKAGLEWTLVCLAYNLKRLFNMKAPLRAA